MQKLLLWSGVGFVVLIIVIVAVSLTSRAKRSKTAAPKDETVTLNFWNPVDDPTVWKQIIQNFESRNPKIKINLVSKPLDQYELEAANALAAGDGPDVWMIHNSWIKRHLDKLEPAPEGIFKKNKRDKTNNAAFVKNKYSAIVIAENISGNQVYTLPLSVDTLALYTNPDLLKSRQKQLAKQRVKTTSNLFTVGPRTWNEVTELVLQYKNGGEPPEPVIALGEADNVRFAPDIVAALMLQNNTSMITPDGLTAAFNLPGAKQTGQKFIPGAKALEFYTKFSNPRDSSYTWNENFGDSYAEFLAGRLAMMVSYQETERALKQAAPDLRFKQLPLPQIDGATKAVDFASYWTLSVPKLSPNKPAAWQFVAYLHTIALNQYLAASGRPSPLKPKNLPRSVLERIEVHNPFKYQTQTAASWDRGKDPARVELVFLDMIGQAAQTPSDIQKIIDAAALEVTKILRERQAVSVTGANNGAL